MYGPRGLVKTSNLWNLRVSHTTRCLSTIPFVDKHFSSNMVPDLSYFSLLSDRRKGPSTGDACINGSTGGGESRGEGGGEGIGILDKSFIDLERSFALRACNNRSSSGSEIGS